MKPFFKIHVGCSCLCICPNILLARNKKADERTLPARGPLPPSAHPLDTLPVSFPSSSQILKVNNNVPLTTRCHNSFVPCFRL